MPDELNSTKPPKSYRLPVNLEPGKPLDPKTIFLIVLIAFWSRLAVLGHANRLVSTPMPAAERLKSAGYLVAGALGLLFSWFTWKIGGFAELRTLRVVPVLLHLKDLLVLGIHYIGRLTRGAGVVGVFLSMMLAITGQTAQDLQYVAGASVALLVAGGILTTSTRGRAVTLRWRIDNLKTKLVDVGKSAEAARKGLSQANLALVEIEAELVKQSAAFGSETRRQPDHDRVVEGRPSRHCCLAAHEAPRGPRKCDSHLAECPCWRARGRHYNSNNWQ